MKTGSLCSGYLGLTGTALLQLLAGYGSRPWRVHDIAVRLGVGRKAEDHHNTALGKSLDRLVHFRLVERVGDGRMIPAEALHPNEAAVLTALVRVHAVYGRATVRDVAAASGVSVSTAHKWLVRLSASGAVAWDRERAGTLRPLVGLVKGD